MAILPSLVAGPTDIPLYDEPLGTLLKERVAQYGDKPALVSCWQNYRASFKDLDKASSNVARALIDLRVRRGQHVGVFAGNRHEYIDVFLGGARIGRPVVVLNSMYTPTELCTAVERSGTTLFDTDVHRMLLTAASQTARLSSSQTESGNAT